MTKCMRLSLGRNTVQSCFYEFSFDMGMKAKHCSTHYNLQFIDL